MQFTDWSVQARMVLYIALKAMLYLLIDFEQNT